MKKIKTYWWFWILIPFCLLFGFVFGFNSTLDIPVHDTYFVISTWQISIGVSIFLFISGFGYLIQSLEYNRVWGKIHILLTYAGLFLILFPINLIGAPKPPQSNTNFDFQSYLESLNNIISFGILLVLLGVLSYFINLGFTILKKKQND